MIFILWITVLSLTAAVAFFMGVGAGVVKGKERIEDLEHTMHEVNKFAMQQAATGDTTGSVVVDMIFNSKKG